MNKKRYFSRIISVFLALAMLIAIVPAEAIAEEQKDRYISGIILEQGSTMDEAKKKISDAGYIPYPQNLNDGTYEDVVLLGYKLTENKAEAITDLKVMDMEGGYAEWNYREMIAENCPELPRMISEMEDACELFRENYKTGTKNANLAMEYLNSFCVPKEADGVSGQLLGEYLIDPVRTTDDFEQIFLLCNTLIQNVISSNILLGCTPDSAERAVEIDLADYYYIDDTQTTTMLLPDGLLSDMVKNIEAIHADPEDLAQEGAFEQYEKLYKKEAGELARAIASYQYAAEEAIYRFEDNGGLASEDTEMMAGMTDLLIDGELEASAKNDSLDLYYVLLNTIFSNYTFTNWNDEEMTLAEYFDCLAYAEEINQAKFAYPLVLAMNSEQLYASRTLGFIQVIVNVLVNDEARTEMRTRLKESQDTLKSETGMSPVSVWIGTNKDIYDKEFITVTEDTVRANALDTDIDDILATKQFSNTMKKTLTFMGCAAGVALGISLLTLGIPAVALQMSLTGVFTMGFFAFANITACGVAATICAAVGVVFAAAVVLLIAAILIVGIIWLIDAIKASYAYHHPQYTEIPDVIFDYKQHQSGETTTVRYNAVASSDGKPADLNAWSGVKWIALYYTKDVNAGAPLTAEIRKNGIEYFDAKYGTTYNSSAMSPLCKFGESSAYDLDSHCYYNDNSGVYLFFYHEGNEVTKVSSKAEYLSDLRLIVTDKEANARDFILKKENFQVLDTNLAPHSGYNVYLGYKTTDNPSNAITDIRVTWGGSAPFEIHWGDNSLQITYASALDTTCGKLDPKTQCQAMPISTYAEREGDQTKTDFYYNIYYTKSKYAGTPIYADTFHVVSDLSDIPEGFEGVNLFSGGTAFNFDFWEGQNDKSGYWDKTRYLCFEPSVKFTAENSSVLYLGGVSFISGSIDWLRSDWNNDDPLQHYADQLGLTVDIRCSGSSSTSRFDMTTGDMWDSETDKTYMAVSYTYNPYRAISRIGTFTGEPKSMYLAESLSANGHSYMASQVFVQGDKYYYKPSNILYGNRHIRLSHTYITKVGTEGYMDMDDAIILPRAMYVAGPSVVGLDASLKSDQNAVLDAIRRNAITWDGLIVSDKPLDYLGGKENNGDGAWKTVHELWDVYHDEVNNAGTLTSAPINLASKSAAPAYMYYYSKASLPKRGKYVVGVNASYASYAEGDDGDNEDYYSTYNDAMTAAMASGDEVINPYESFTTSNADENANWLKTAFWNASYSANCWIPDSMEDTAEYYINRHCFITASYSDSYVNSVGSIILVEKDKNENAPLTEYYYLESAGENVKYTRVGDTICLNDDTNPNKGFYFYTAAEGEIITSVKIMKAERTATSEEALFYPADEYINSLDALAANYASSGGTENAGVKFRKTMKKPEGYENLHDKYGGIYHINTKKYHKYLQCTFEAQKYISNMKFVIVGADIGSSTNPFALAQGRLAAMGCTEMVGTPIYSLPTISGNTAFYTYLGYSRTSNPANAIKDIIILESSDLPSGAGSYEKNGYTYTKVQGKYFDPDRSNVVYENGIALVNATGVPTSKDTYDIGYAKANSSYSSSCILVTKGNGGDLNALGVKYGITDLCVQYENISKDFGTTQTINEDGSITDALDDNWRLYVFGGYYPKQTDTDPGVMARACAKESQPIYDGLKDYLVKASGLSGQMKFSITQNGVLTGGGDSGGSFVLLDTTQSYEYDDGCETQVVKYKQYEYSTLYFVNASCSEGLLAKTASTASVFSEGVNYPVLIGLVFISISSIVIAIWYSMKKKEIIYKKERV